MCSRGGIVRYLAGIFLVFFLVSNLQGEVGRAGGTLVISEHSEPKTLNPLMAADTPSKTIVGLTSADLIHINRYTQRTEPALAKSWTASPDGRHYTLYLRHGVRFSDGSPFNADDVIFSWNAYLDEKTHSPQRDLLIISGKPITVRKIDEYTVEFTLAQPYAAAERLFDSIAMLPRHLLQPRYEQGTLAEAWGLGAHPEEIAGLGPFRFKAYVPGQRIVLERNPYYWKKGPNGQALPYLDSIVSIFAANADAEALRFDAGDTDMVSRLSAADYDVLRKDEERRHFHLYDLGPGLEDDFLFFNQNATSQASMPGLSQKQSWFRQVAFRRAISSAIDRADIVRLAYRGRAYPLSSQASPGNKLWVDRQIPAPVHSVEQARRLLSHCGFKWRQDGSLADSRGNPVNFSILVNAGNPQQVEAATLIQNDLKELGIGVSLDQVEFHTFLNRIFTSYKYEAALMRLADGDADPNSELNVLTSNGSAHVWCLKPAGPPPSWQRDLDRLMQEQLTAMNYPERKRIYDRVQQILWENAPVIYLISPHILVGAKDRVGNFRPAILGTYTLWNAEQLFIRQ
ncbi:MAG TPA: ABC transporter substrate-binding protein [Bryobacteraceae bacterium]|nr:ABC transporter substrate-binding protein [Bryobacteraceae bacterium]